MTDEEKKKRLLELATKLGGSITEEVSHDEQMSRAIHMIERTFKARVNEEYPLMKFFNQLEMINWYQEEKKLAYERER